MNIKNYTEQDFQNLYKELANTWSGLYSDTNTEVKETIEQILNEYEQTYYVEGIWNFVIENEEDTEEFRRGLMHVWYDNNTEYV